MRRRGDVERCLQASLVAGASHDAAVDATLRRSAPHPSRPAGRAVRPCCFSHGTSTDGVCEPPATSCWETQRGRSRRPAPLCLPRPASLSVPSKDGSQVCALSHSDRREAPRALCCERDGAREVQVRQREPDRARRRQREPRLYGLLFVMSFLSRSYSSWCRTGLPARVASVLVGRPFLLRSSQVPGPPAAR